MDIYFTRHLSCLQDYCNLLIQMRVLVGLFFSLYSHILVLLYIVHEFDLSFTKVVFCSLFGWGALCILFCSCIEGWKDHFNFYSFLQFVAATQPINSLAFVFDGLHYGASDFAYAAYSMVCKHELFCNLVISSWPVCESERMSTDMGDFSWIWFGFNLVSQGPNKPGEFIWSGIQCQNPMEGHYRKGERCKKRLSM